MLSFASGFPYWRLAYKERHLPNRWADIFSRPIVGRATRPRLGEYALRYGGTGRPNFQPLATSAKEITQSPHWRAEGVIPERQCREPSRS